MANSQRKSRVKSKIHDNLITKICMGLAITVLVFSLSFLSASSFFAGATGNNLSAALPFSVNSQGISIGGVGIGFEAGPGGIGINIDTDGSGKGQQPGCGNADNCLSIPGAGTYHGISSTTSFRVALQKWTNFFLGFFSLIAMIAIIYAGFQYVTARGEDEQAGKAKKGIIYTTIGIIVVLLAYALVNTLIVSGPKGSDLAQAKIKAVPTLNKYLAQR